MSDLGSEPHGKTKSTRAAPKALMVSPPRRSVAPNVVADFASADVKGADRIVRAARSAFRKGSNAAAAGRVGLTRHRTRQHIRQ